MKKLLSGLVLILGLNGALFAEKMTIFAASDLRFALDEVKQEFLKQNPNDELEMIYGSSGKGMHQIENAAPYDIYFSANMDYVEKLYQKGDIVTKPKLYAIGRIVIWSKNKAFDPKLGFKNFTQDWAKKIAIANPSHAPYGEKAKQSMESMNIYNTIEPKLVLGENISQTAGFIASETADIGVIALSLALAPTIADSKFNQYHLIDAKLHEPLMQGYGITKVGNKKALAKKFYEFMETKRVNEIMKQYGFEVNQGESL
ncbi:MAG: molybdate ABC transporter substrate-binding protein [Sulfurovum sp.]|nr:molybdate ABC transporter substrate-binding protein [Sulfurovum sp.]MDD3500325.1 molybdate ABC transporter substrate-binding protein [Sulfurovum sp.]